MFIVTDCEFNRIHNGADIGRKFVNPPSYTIVQSIDGRLSRFTILKLRSYYQSGMKLSDSFKMLNERWNVTDKQGVIQEWRVIRSKANPPGVGSLPMSYVNGWKNQ